MYITEKNNFRLVSKNETTINQAKEAFAILEAAERVYKMMNRFAETYKHDGYVWDFSQSLVVEIDRKAFEPQKNRVEFYT